MKGPPGSSQEGENQGIFLQDLLVLGDAPSDINELQFLRHQ